MQEQTSGDFDPQAPNTASQREAAAVGSEKVAAGNPPGQITQLVSTIKNVEQQVGEHVIAALQQDDTVAVLTTVVIGQDGQRHVVSAALDPAQTQQVNDLLQGAQQQREEEEKCVGYHCLIRNKPKSDSPATDG